MFLFIKRLLNAFILALVPGCIYLTYKVKAEGKELQDRLQYVEAQIRKEKRDISVYKAELANLTGMTRLTALSEKLAPEMRSAEAARMKTPDDLPVTGYDIADPFSKGPYSVLTASQKTMR